jgi:tripartite-type tricarboxylate transporter receptor subunit TctC
LHNIVVVPDRARRTAGGIGPHLYGNLPYDPARDFSPVILLAKLPLIMAVTASLPVRSVGDVIALAKANPGLLAFASSGTGSAPHLTGVLFKTLSAIDLLHVPYRGSGPAVVDLIAGRIAIMFDAAPSLLPFIASGQLRAIAGEEALGRNLGIADASGREIEAYALESKQREPVQFGIGGLVVD